MAEEMRKLASVLMEASNVAGENERLQREMNKLRADIDKDRQRRIISELQQERQEDRKLIEKLTLKVKNLKQKAGNQKHRADMLDVQLQLLIKKTQTLIRSANNSIEFPADQ